MNRDALELPVEQPVGVDVVGVRDRDEVLERDALVKQRRRRSR